MKWYFSLNEPGLNYYGDLARAAVNSALANTRLRPHLLWDGPDNAFVRWCADRGVTVIPLRSPLHDAIRAAPNRPGWIQHTADGAYLRLEVAEVERDADYVLYTDCDVLFLRDPGLEELRPRVFACAPEFEPDDWSYANTGVMVMNVAALRAGYDDLHAFVRARGPDAFPAYDQGALNEFYDGLWERLDPRFNWKPYWGRDDAVSILHFHGVKPRNIRNLAMGVERLPSDAVARPLYERDPEACRHWFEVAESWLWREAPRRSRWARLLGG